MYSYGRQKIYQKTNKRLIPIINSIKIQLFINKISKKKNNIINIKNNCSANKKARFLKLHFKLFKYKHGTDLFVLLLNHLQHNTIISGINKNSFSFSTIF